MLFSIVTVTFNSGETLKRTINSLLSQTISNFEFIIVDGKSSDNTVDIIKSFEQGFAEKDIRFTWISEKDTGIYDAFNKGVKLAKGNWISFLGSDDFYTENALDLYAEQIKNQSKELDFIHSVVKVEGKKVIKDKWEWKHFRKGMNIAHVGAFHSKNYFKKYGLYNTNYKIAGDYELLLRAKQHLKTHWFNEVTAIMADGGISNSQVKNVYLETTKAKIESGKINYFVSKLYYFKWMFKYRVKTILNAIIR
ncbi:glycosyltransferase family 2 protein [Polaribacter sp. PL03]|uniref:glycosyltransferase family 2 protein n=1 Tax=Polaribacter sp. PL03 TaxID=3088353 RepID=UPI0029D19D80|nr:glycosyltransferase family 2 protein [Polaribacter sp. PL03]MDX6745248.1 glycosyltransferase family 2 protein [Polaribacter sp. PL03]